MARRPIVIFGPLVGETPTTIRRISCYLQRMARVCWARGQVSSMALDRTVAFGLSRSIALRKSPSGLVFATAKRVLASN